MCVFVWPSFTLSSTCTRTHIYFQRQFFFIPPDLEMKLQTTAWLTLSSNLAGLDKRLTERHYFNTCPTSEAARCDFSCSPALSRNVHALPPM